MPRVLLAFDKFKDALTAPEAVAAVADALREIWPDWTLDPAPLADGGEGFASILTQAAGGREVSSVATGPRGERLQAGFGIVPVAAIPAGARAQLQLSTEPTPGATVAIIEMAAISGLALLPQDQRDPWQATTLGTGELMHAAADSGAVAILLGVGGSATNDLGLGALAALGLEFIDAAGQPATRQFRPSGRRLSGYPAVCSRGCRRFILPVMLPIRCSVRAEPPQFMARRRVCVRRIMPASKARVRGWRICFASIAESQPALKDVPGAGAAGGIAFGLMTAAGAKLLPGFDLVSAWLDLETKLAAADIVITGEGRFDDSSLEGKGPGAVAARALALGKTVHVFAGQVSAAARPGLALHAITPAGVPLAQALRAASQNLTASARSRFCALRLRGGARTIEPCEID
jgi:glycerate kinase